MSLQSSHRRQVISAIIAGLFAVFALLAYYQPVNAQSDIKNQNSNVIQDCEELEVKLDELVATFDQRRNDHNDNYDQLSTLYGEIIEKLEGARYKVAILKELHPGLERRIVHFDKTSEEFVSELIDVRDSACRDKKSFMQELDEARESLKNVQSAVADINEYVGTVLLASVNNVVNGGGGN